MSVGPEETVVETAIEEAVEAEPRKKPNFTRLVAALTGANALLAISSLVTGPLQARALGPSGRGDLAAIIVPLTLAPTFLDLGLTSYIVRARARGETRENLLGTLFPISLVFSLVGVIGAVPFAHAIGHGRDTVETCLIIGLAMSPIWVVLLTAQGLPWGEERWWSATFVRIAAPIITAPAMLALYLFDALTIETAFAVFIAAGLVSNAPLVFLMLRTGRWRFKRAIVREGIHFGSRAWFGNLFNSTYARLDQVLMAGLVAPRELGLYAVAVSIAGVPGSFTGAIATAINPRVAQGRRELVRQSSRVGLFLTLCGCGAMALILPVFLPTLFGHEFDESIHLTWILLAGSVSYSVVGTLLSAISAAGHPGAGARVQLIVLVPTIAALVALLSSTGALGAAIITSASNTALCALLLFQARRLLGGRIRDYLVVQRADLRAIRDSIRARRRRGAATEAG